MSVQRYFISLLLAIRQNWLLTNLLSQFLKKTVQLPHFRKNLLLYSVYTNTFYTSNVLRKFHYAPPHGMCVSHFYLYINHRSQRATSYDSHQYFSFFIMLLSHYDFSYTLACFDEIHSLMKSVKHLSVDGEEGDIHRVYMHRINTRGIFFETHNRTKFAPR